VSAVGAGGAVAVVGGLLSSELFVTAEIGNYMKADVAGIPVRFAVGSVETGVRLIDACRRRV
jgi:hypothetical protein